MDAIEILSAAGIGGIIGSIVTTFFQALMASRQKMNERAFQEKKEAYVGFLDAYRILEVDDESQANLKNFGYWDMRCAVVASPDVKQAITYLKQSAPNSDARDAANQRLLSSIQKDLRVS
ncbi:MAG: hypothetical protein AAF621_01495 [Pseudomonadota bacterium]